MSRIVPSVTYELVNLSYNVSKYIVSFTSVRTLTKYLRSSNTIYNDTVHKIPGKESIGPCL